MGNSMSHQRHYLYWGAVLLLMIPSPDSVHGWNIPYFGGGDNGPTNNIDDGVRIDSSPMPSTDPLSAATSKIPSNIPLLSTVAAPLIGPIDAPHLRYIPSYFSNQLPPRIKELFPTILSTFHSTRLKLYQFLWYKPPVGIVGAWTFLRILERVYGVFSPPPPTSSEEALADAEGKLRGVITSIMPSTVTSKLSPWGSIGKVYSANIQNQQMQKRRRKRKRKVRKGRSFDLDRGDRSYDDFGGIETVRVRAFQEGLRSALAVTSELSSLDSNTVDNNVSKGTSLFGVKQKTGDENTGLNYDTLTEYTEDMETAQRALQLSCPPRGSREFFVEQSIECLSALGKYVIPTSTSKETGPKRNKSLEPASSIQVQNIHLLLHHSSKLIELRTLDALLRTLRDRHLIVSTRLRRTREYWKWHVNLSGGQLGHFVQGLRQQVMTVFPTWMGDDFRDRNQREYELATATLERELEWLGKVEKMLLKRPTEMEVGDLLTVVGDVKQNQISWWNSFANSGGEGKGYATISKPSMSDSVRLLLQSKNRIWLRQTEQWSREAREVIKDSLDETISSSFTSINDSEELEYESGKAQEHETDVSNLYVESRFLKKWAKYDDNASDASSWLTVLSLVDYAASPKRAGERRRYFQLSSLTAKIKRYDFLGIPSSALLLVGADSLHDIVIAPHKQEIVDFVKSIFTAIWGIVEFRFYTPMKDIVLDLLNRRPRMVDPFALLNEQTSLDNMLLGLGVGDGTRASRSAALAAASRLYEQEVSGGAIRGILRGNVAQLMLIQIQQLKADLLQESE